MTWNEIKITDRRYIRAQEEWKSQGKTANEIAVLTSDMLDEDTKQKSQNADPGSYTRFPEAICDLISSVVFKAIRRSPTHDSSNDTFRYKMKGGMGEANALFKEFTNAYNELLVKDPAIAEWGKDNYPMFSISDHDEQYEMRELEDRSPSQGSPIVRSKQEKKEKTE